MAPWARVYRFLGVWTFAATTFAQDNFPDAETFLRASRWRAVKLGDYVYLDGGVVSQDGYTDWRYANPMNATLSIDCSKSWTPDTIEVKEIERLPTMKVTSLQAMFADPSSDAFYIWGGSDSFASSQTDTQAYWKFSADGKGEGSWNRESPASAQVFQTLDARDAATVVSTPDAGFIFGGKQIAGSFENEEGFVVYNYTNKEWSSNLDAPYSGDGTVWGGQATYIEKYGTAGVILILGGISGHDRPHFSFLEFETIHFYDVGTQTWHKQKTTGDERPSRRAQHCAVGVGGSGANDTYEIFMYGGRNEDEQADYGDVWVLSLPGFRWTKVSDEAAHSRSGQACLPIGSRQLLSMGGALNYDEDYDDSGDSWRDPDPNPRGLGIFDMSALEWKDSYDADAGDYETNETIRSWYEDGRLETVDWSSPEASALFAAEEVSGNENGNDDQGNSKADDNSSESSTPVGAIAGGVVGGVAAIAIIGALIWFWRRRRRSGYAQPSVEVGPIDDKLQYDEMGARGQAYSPPQYGPGAPAELSTPPQHGKATPAELSTPPQHELGATVELSTPPAELAAPPVELPGQHVQRQ